MSRARGTNRRLPPLLSVSPVDGWRDVTSGHRPAHSPTSASRYHVHCCLPSGRISPGPGGYLEPQLRRPSVGRNLRSPKVNGRPQSIVRPKRVWEFLETHEDFLEDYVLNKVDLERLERWIVRKMQKGCKHSANGNSEERSSLSRWKSQFGVDVDKRQLLQQLTNSVQNCPSKAHVLNELAKTLAPAVGATSWTLYFYDPNSQDLYRFGPKDQDENNEIDTISVENGGSLAAYVARTKEAVRWKTCEKDSRFPEGIFQDPETETYVLCHAISLPDGELSGVLELHKTSYEFYEEDEEIVNSYLAWGGVTLHYAELYSNMMRQRELNTFLLTVVKSIFQDMVSMDTVILKIMAFARELVSADRASLFLVDSRANEMYARLFDVSGEQPSPEGPKGQNEIRFPIGKGIAGFVAMTGELLNIPDAYNDERFNRSIDQQTGYSTKNLLCMPVFIRGSVIGVVQMVNKSSGSFTKLDEEAFTTFAIYCGLALHHAKLYDKIRRSEQKNKVALEILSYHNTCGQDEFLTIKNSEFATTMEELKDFDFAPSSLSSEEKVTASILMLLNLPNLHSVAKIDEDDLTRFALTVRKNYRRVPYHNWTHGFSVANSAYAIIHQSGVFQPLEELALYVACLCHDLDHRGKTNQFLINSASPLAAIYTTSTLEHHHFNMTVSILQQDGHNIFRNLTSADYKKVLSCIKHCILATDLALFFPCKARLTDIVKAGLFDWDCSDHRQLLQAITMTACDLCASTKSWDLQSETVRVIFQEFYDQGDVEKSQGRTPVPSMDREKVNEQPNSQVGFLKGICMPCYELLFSLIPESKPMLEGCRRNLDQWENFVQEKTQAQEDTSDDEIKEEKETQ